MNSQFRSRHWRAIQNSEFKNSKSPTATNSKFKIQNSKMKILVLGAGKMGSFFLDVLSFDHETAVYEKDPKRMRFTYNCQRFTTLDEIKEFQPQLVINAVTLKYTISAFNEVLPVLPDDCIISDISSVKTNLSPWG